MFFNGARSGRRPRTLMCSSASSRVAAAMTSYPSRPSTIAIDRAMPGSSSMCKIFAPLGGAIAIVDAIGTGSCGNPVVTPRAIRTVKVDLSPRCDLMVTPKGIRYMP